MESREPKSKSELLTTGSYSLPKAELPSVSSSLVIQAAGGTKEVIRNSTCYFFFPWVDVSIQLQKRFFLGFNLSKDFLCVMTISISWFNSASYTTSIHLN